MWTPANPMLVIEIEGNANDKTSRQLITTNTLKKILNMLSEPTVDSEIKTIVRTSNASRNERRALRSGYSDHSIDKKAKHNIRANGANAYKNLVIVTLEMVARKMLFANINNWITCQATLPDESFTIETS